MSAVWVTPPAVTPAVVRRLPGGDGEVVVRVQRVDVPVVPAAQAVPRQHDHVDLRLRALKQENDRLRRELAQLRSS